MLIDTTYTLFALIILVSFALIAKGQTNTHQTITKTSQILEINLEKSDHVKVTVSNTTGHVSIEYDMTGIPFRAAVADFCHSGDKVELSWISQWTSSGVIKIKVTAYEYSYDITVNGVVFKK